MKQENHFFSLHIGEVQKASRQAKESLQAVEVQEAQLIN
jgi:hypothetical protein